MYLKYWGLKEKPFENTPDPRFVYFSPAHDEAYARLKYVIDNKKGAAMLTGEYGAGKTLLARVLVRELMDESCNVALIVNPMLTRIELLKEILFQLKTDRLPEGKLEILHLLNKILYENFNNGKSTVIIIDESQAINRSDVFEELRLLLNFQLNDRFLLTLILIGQPELNRKIDRIPQLKQRLALTYHLTGLDNPKVCEYVGHRLRIAGAARNFFREEAIEEINQCTKGIPRKINNICEIGLLQGMFEKKETIDRALIGKILEDLSP